MRPACRHVLVLAILAAVCALAPAAHAKTVWLCKPGLRSNPCTPGLKTTSIAPDGTVGDVFTPPAAAHPKIDCFYVYPTVSNQPTPQATRRIDAEERSIALYQAARYESDCRVFAPMYRQITVAGLLNASRVTAKMRAQGYADVRNAFREYLKRYNKGRGIAFVGHSQGTFVLRELLAKEVDRKPAVRKRLVSAILLGGNVTVKAGQTSGGDFKHISACTSDTDLGCVIAFSTFNATPPADAIFGKATTAGQAVLCTNPAALGGGSGTLTSIYPSKPFAPKTTIGVLTNQIGVPRPAVSTPWIQSDAYTAQCTSAGGINVLTITPLAGAPTLKALPTAQWGLHLVDANIALGNLVSVVHAQAAAFTAR
jgi:hypothetical protein